MNEVQRLQYLEALDLTQWVSKAELPYAKESEYVDLREFQQNALNEEELEQVASDLEVLTEEIRPPFDSQRPATDVVVDAKVKQEFKQEAGQGAEQEAGQQALTKPSTETYEGLFNIQGKRGQYLLVADVRVGSQMTQAEQVLMNNIAKSIDGLMANPSTTAVIPEQFKWPLFDSHYQADHIDVSKNAARDSFKAFVDSRLKKHQVSLLVLLGKEAADLLDLSESERQFKNAAVISGASLTAMLESQSSQLKRELWHKLLEYKSH